MLHDSVVSAVSPSPPTGLYQPLPLSHIPVTLLTYLSTSYVHNRLPKRNSVSVIAHQAE